MLKNLVLLWHDLRGRPSSGRFGEPQALEEPSFLTHCDGFAPAVSQKEKISGGFASPNPSTA